MAASARPARKTAPAYCPGSYKKVPSNGYKTFASGRRYPCPECGKYYPRGWDGTFNKHGFKVAIKPPKRLAACAECHADVYDLDYLCQECRASQSLE